METTEHEKKLAGGVAVITGAGSGIGAGLARRAGELGMTVVAADINLPGAEAVADAIRQKGGKAEAHRVDVSVPEELDRLADDVFARHGAVRLLINNAGMETLGFAWEIPAARWEATLRVNINGVVHGVRAFAGRMVAGGAEAWIANLSSVGGFSVMPTQTAYIMTKHAVQAFTECLYLEMELKGANVHVCSVIPGMLKTNIFTAEAGKGEAGDAARYREKMFALMRDYGMDLDEGCRVIMAKIAAGEFWVSTQPDMTAGALAGRIEFMKDQRRPAVAEAARHLLE